MDRAAPMTVPRRRLRVAVTAVAVLATLTIGTTMAATPPMARAAAPSAADTGPTPGTEPRTLAPGFVLDRGRYLGFDAPQAQLSTLPYDVNNRGQIVGRYDDGSSEQAFLRDQRGRFTTLQIPGARSAWASGSNDRGQIVGIYSENTPTVKQQGGRRHGYLWDRGRVTRIDVPGAVEAGAFGINNQGAVVGAYLDTAGRSHGFVWRRGRLTTFDVPGAADTTPQGINDRGQIVGYAADADGSRFRGFLRSRGRYRTFAAPAVSLTLPVGINNRGQISGYTSDAAGTTVRGFLLARGVDGRFTSIRFPGAPFTLATGLNDRGQLVGAYENPNATPSPQPTGTLPMHGMA
jgi:probable HAF family extracellular repeat protein